MIFTLIIHSNNFGTRCEIVLKWLSHNLINAKSTSVHVMTWCRQATSHALSYMASLNHNGLYVLEAPRCRFGIRVSISQKSLVKWSFGAFVFSEFTHIIERGNPKGGWLITITVTSYWARWRLESPPPPHQWIPNRLFRRRLKKTSKLRVTGLWGSGGGGQFPAQRASNAENVSI